MFHAIRASLVAGGQGLAACCDEAVERRRSFLFPVTAARASSPHGPALSCDKLTRRANHFVFSEIVSSPKSIRIENISLLQKGKSGAHLSASCSAKRGVGRRHERGTGSGGRGCALDERHGSVRRSRVVLTPRCWRQVGGLRIDPIGSSAVPPMTVARKPITGESTL
jgi:hypothetical protein